MNFNNPNRIWPGFIPPEENELFSSWLMRLAKEHHTKTYTFSKFYFGNMPIWNRDIDSLTSKPIIDQILKHTVLTINQVKKMFLSSYNEKLCYYFNANGYSPGILNLGLYHRKRINKGLVCCPNCLRQNIPYYRKEWRLVTSIICLKCKCHLIDHCPECGAGIAFHRLESGYKEDVLRYPLNSCWQCKSSLCEDITWVKSEDLIKYQTFFNQTIEFGYNKYCSYSFLYFPIYLSLVQKLFSSSSIFKKYQDAIGYEMNEELCLEKGINVHNSTLEQRLPALIGVYRIMDNWPNNFIIFRKKYQIGRCYLTKDINLSCCVNAIPYWYELGFQDSI
ncbi:TniQ family protein [Marinigracilibium pacificum]|uniref:TniQ family protein n=1 Tax=Marinigracilibium pacificum TaxID=2729599 RepID=A0A848J3K4_9BACT|nr:TniQ family protein [Marinigracilibium pacificum]NMM50316.1 TniQ family protein [Marinigracilibium pacificum]